MNTMKLTLIFASIAATAVACGDAAREIDARIEAPETRESKIALRPKLDVSNLYDPAIADRIVLEGIELNVSDVRLLGPDPRMPVGGLQLLNKSVVLEAYDGADPSLELPFPAYLADQDDLAVYIRVDRSEQLMNASVVIRGRIYSRPVKGGSNGLTASSNDDSMKKEGEVEGVDPDGDPADCWDRGVDPDGDPADPCYGRRNLVSRGEASKSVPFELRGDDVADLIAGIDSNAALDVLIGIPASRWFTPESMRAIDAELSDHTVEESGKVDERMTGKDTVVIDSRLADKAEAHADEGIENEDYFAAEDNTSLDELKFRRPDRTR